jgi:hypothetical protein
MASILDVFEYNQHFVAMMNIINNARLCDNKKGHKHHIIPRCWFKMMQLPIDNSKSNLVMLTPEEHLKVHQLAILCAKDDAMRSKMGFAVKRLLNGNFSGMKHTDETKALIKAKRALQIMTEESNRKRSIALKGRIFTDEHKAKLKTNWHLSHTKMPSFKGNKHSEESRKKMSEARYRYLERKRLCQAIAN